MKRGRCESGRICVRVVSVLSSGAWCLVLSCQVMRLSSLRACMLTEESGIGSLTSLSPAEGCLTHPGIGDIFLDPSRRLCSLMRLGLVVALWSLALLRGNAPCGGHPTQ